MIVDISDADFQRLVNFIKSNYGINLAQKRQLITSRLASLLQQEGYSSFTPFVDKLLKERNPNHIEQVLNRLTTNYTYFMREEEHFRAGAQAPAGQSIVDLECRLLQRRRAL